MELRTRSNPQREPKVNGVKVKPSTKIFKDRIKANDYSNQKQSYVMDVVKVEKVEDKLIEEFHGYGVPQ